jgi:DNA-directed RNA polymerase subunit alpha
MISQLRAIVGFKEEPIVEEVEEKSEPASQEALTSEESEMSKEDDSEFLKTRVESLDLSTRTTNALTEANIRTVGGLVRKREEDILALPGLGSKGVQEIKRALSNFGVTLK